MSAPTCTTTQRFTSKDIVVQFLPCLVNPVPQNHVQHFYFHADVAAGTFKLRVNGEETAAITFSDTAATLVTNVNTALAALDGVGATELILSGSNVTDMTLTSDATDGVKYYIIEVSDQSALTGNTSDEPNVTTRVTQQGSTWYTISNQFSSFGTEETVDTVETTSIAEYEATEVPVKQTMTFNASIYEANEEWAIAVFAGQSGIFRVWPQGKFVGFKWFSFRGLIETVSTDYPDHDIVEKTVDGQRQGSMLIPFNSIYKG